jgi:hypothetical protein
MHKKGKERKVNGKGKYTHLIILNKPPRKRGQVRITRSEILFAMERRTAWDPFGKCRLVGKTRAAVGGRKWKRRGVT